MLLFALQAAHKGAETSDNTLTVGILLFLIVASVVSRLLMSGSDKDGRR